MRTLNLGILAHVDAGKTTLTERLLFAAGVIDEIGSVDAGSTQTDSLALERQRGITIKSAVVSFVIGDVAVNLIDTPGHPDFIAEVERALGVLDGAVLVVSAVEGVQAQTTVLMRALRRLGIPMLIFVNKIDRPGAGYDRVISRIADRLTPAIVAMGRVSGLGGREAGFTSYGAGDGAFRAVLADQLAGQDDALLADWVAAGGLVPYRRLADALAAQARRGLVHPVFFGSAITGAGIDALMAGLAELLPAAEADLAGPVRGTVFKVERGPAGERIGYVRMFSGTLRPRDRVRFGQGRTGKVTSVSVFDRGQATRRGCLVAGQIGKLWGLAEVRVGDVIGGADDQANGDQANGDQANGDQADGGQADGGQADGGHADGGQADGGRRAPRRSFPPPTLETIVTARRAADKGALHAALAQLAEQDPLISLRQDDLRGELLVSLYGEVQKEVIQATLADDFGIEVTFRESTTICIERPVGTGAAVEVIGAEPNPFLAGVGLRVDPAAAGSGLAFRLQIELGALPPSFLTAIRQTVPQVLRQGIYGWQVTDCVVTLTHSGYYPRQSHAHAHFDKSMSSTAGDFRNLTPLVLMDALRQAGTAVYEPVHGFRLEFPADAFGPVLPALTRLRAVPGGPVLRGLLCVLEGEIPAARVHDLRQQLPSLTRGEGVLESAFARYQQVTGEIPVRPRSDRNPLNRKEYLLQVARRAPAG